MAKKPMSQINYSISPFLRVVLSNPCPLTCILPFYGFPSSSVGKKKIHLQCRRPRFNSWVGKIPLWKGMATPKPFGSPSCPSDHAYPRQMRKRRELETEFWPQIYLLSDIKDHKHAEFLKIQLIITNWSLLFSRSVVSDSLQTHGLQHARIPCPSLSPGACSNSCPLSWWCHSCHPLSSPSPPALNLSQHQGLFKWVSSSHQVAKVLGVSAGVLPMNIQDWFPLGLTGLISLQSKGLSRVFSNTTVQRTDSSVFSLLYGPIPTSIQDYWKNYSFD